MSQPSPTFATAPAETPLSRHRPAVVHTPPGGFEDSTTEGGKSSNESSPPRSNMLLLPPPMYPLRRASSDYSVSSEAEMHSYLQRRTVEVWQKRVIVASWAHQQLASDYRAHARSLNVLNVALNALIGSAIFASLGDSATSFYLRTAAGIISMLVAIIGSVKSELNFDGLHEQHKLAHRKIAR